VLIARLNLVWEEPTNAEHTMRVDIHDILDDWPYEPGQITARRIRGDDGSDKLQLRLEMGIMQMNLTGRPDGMRPLGYDSYLDYHLAQLQRFKDAGTEDGFTLDEQSCQDLRNEGMLFYHRYLAAFVLEDFSLVIADADHSLAMMDLIRKHAAEESDKFLIEQYRPYVLAMRARATSRMLLEAGEPRAALMAVNEAMQNISDCLSQFQPDGEVPPSGELAILQALAEEIESQVPVDPMTKLRKEIDQALEEERYEDAAVLRDQLKRATGEPEGPAGPVDDTPAE
jgi:hypothetical protein